MSAPVASKIRSPSSPSIATRAKSNGLGECAGGGEHRLELQVGQPQGRRLGGTVGRRTYSAGECSRTASMTQVR